MKYPDRKLGRPRRDRLPQFSAVTPPQQELLDSLTDRLGIPRIKPTDKADAGDRITILHHRLTKPAPAVPEGPWRDKPPTDAQTRCIRGAGLTVPATRGEASDMISHLKAQQTRKAGERYR